MDGRGRAESSLTTSAELVGELDAILWRADAATRALTYVSPATESLLGIPRSAWLREPDFAAGLIYPEDRAAALAAYVRAVERREPADVEFRVLSADGRLVWLHNSIRVHPDRDGGPDRLHGVMIDVNERKLAERRLLAQYAVTAALAEADALDAAAPRIIQALCETFGWVLGALWLVDDSGFLAYEEGWHAPTLDAGFSEISRQMTFEAGVGLPGRVLASGAPAWVRDVVEDDNFPRAEHAARADLHGACAFPIVHRDETVGVIEFFARVVREPDPELLALMGATGTQIGQFLERRQAEQARRSSEARAAAILASALDCIISMDASGSVVEFNQAAEETFGYAREDVIGREMCELLVPEQLRDAHRRGLARYLATGNGPILGQRLELPALRSDGTTFPAELAIVRVDLPGPPLFTGYLRDLSERVEAAEALRQSEKQYRLLFESNPNPMWVYDLETLEFLAVNEAAIRTYGYSRDEFLAMTIADIRPPEDVPRLLAAVDRIAGGFMRSGPWRHRKRDGTVIEVEISSHTLVFEGKRAEVVLAHDITERARLEEQLRQAQKMEAIGQLAGGIAHDFNNIALVIGGHSRAILDLVPEAERAHASAREISRAADRAGALTRQLLAFSRRQVLQPEHIDLSEIVRRLKPMLARLIGEDVQIELSLAPEPALVWADPSQIEQVVMNLALNARDAMPAGGRLSIETKAVELGEAAAQERLELDPGSYVALVVSDTGEGMDDATQTRIFEPFFTTKEPDKGTGLGLSTVYGIVKQSRGAVTVYSEPGQGTVFRVYLPRRLDGAPAATGSEARPAEAVGTPTGTETILLVEDDEQARTLVHLMLERLGYTVLAASNGGEALALFEAHQAAVDLIVTDLVMPGMSGSELARLIAQRKSGARILFTSGYSGDMLTHHGVEPGSAFLEKPYDEDDLARVMRALLDQPAAGSA